MNAKDDKTDGLARSAAMLWGEAAPGRRGPKPALSLDAIARAAADVADAEGLAAVSMQRVAKELGYTTMSLYTYVPSKDLLVEAMVDIATGPPPPWADAPNGWRPQLLRWTTDLWHVFARHPWGLQATLIGPPLGPNQLAWFERLLSTLSRSGLSTADVSSTAMFVLASVRGLAKIALDVYPAASPAEVAAANAEYSKVLHDVAERGGLSAVAAFAATPPPEADTDAGLPHDLAFGMNLLLDGIEGRVERHRKT
ncbi:MAG TPA: TetR/AcrR family transcriptional regulator [Stackebrandtia sp.]|jgi:AcrR family transcriptional regulator|uniref:TetR/AcrR family transcriptional regulator n=1 Tax=Stackebrandtia sp. TaxID=2023065 RepID=UPI002D37AB8C|nr:TetR/AcrR family transcriptional regulator [Stackebrandtia sp.]HZE41800.1 TetR/AcrR family transcriptional regulator [Stackebrandtia sp.]